jgi:putative ABC transport system substrate-binding protein
MRRREFITLLGGAAAWPLAARAQQRERMRRIGVLMNAVADEPRAVTRLGVFRQALAQLGWSEDRNLRIDVRSAGGDNELIRRYAAELVALGPDLILATTGVIAGALQQTTRTVPIVFVTALDPVGAGVVASLPHPGGNATGFATYEFSLGAKSLELLKEIAPSVTRVAVLRDPSVPAGSGLFGAIQAAASSLRVEVIPLDTRDVVELERAVTAFAQMPNGGLILVAPAFAARSRDLIVALAARHRLPAIYPIRNFVAAGGLMSYGAANTTVNEQYRLAAGYIDRIFKGEKPADLPVQAPTKYELVINLKTAKALGLDVPVTVFARADEVIE